MIFMVTHVVDLSIRFARKLFQHLNGCMALVTRRLLWSTTHRGIVHMLRMHS